MKLTSPVFEDSKPIPKAFSCDGQGIHPPLHISDVSIDTKSLALIVDDPDAPMGTFTHWVMWNIVPTTEEIPEGVVPEEAIEGGNSMGEIGWIAPCPPSGTHHYRFYLFGLSQMLSLPKGSSREALEEAMEKCTLTRVELIGIYTRMS